MSDSDAAHRNTLNDQAPLQPQVRWRQRAEPAAVRGALGATVLLLFAVGLFLELFFASLLARRFSGTVALILWLIYIVVGAAMVYDGRGERPAKTTERSWPMLALSAVVRGPDRQTPIVVQLLVWVTFGHVVAAGLLVGGIIAAIGSLGF